MQKSICQVEGCDRPIRTAPYCSLHYQRVRAKGEPGPAAPLSQRGRMCSVDGCDSRHEAHGFCAMHLRRARKTGTPGGPESQRYGGPCIFDGCGKIAIARKLCDGHYRQHRRGEALTPLSESWKGRGLDRDSQGRKECRDCRQWLTLDNYGIQKRNADGLTTYCDACNWRRHAGFAYGINRERYEEMLTEQGGGCAICGSSNPGGRVTRFSVDHDHSCCPGRRSCGSCVRGLLCTPCNQGIGVLGDDPERLEAAARYLRGRGQR